MKAQQTNLMKRVLVSLLLCGIMVFWGFQVSGEEWTGGGPQRLDNLRGELSYLPEVKKVKQASGSLSERMW